MHHVLGSELIINDGVGVVFKWCDWHVVVYIYSLGVNSLQYMSCQQLFSYAYL